MNRNEDHAVLLVEDEPRAAQMLAKGLREQADAVDVVGDGKRAVYQAAITEYDAIVLDVVLPLQDGLAVCRAIRQEGSVSESGPRALYHAKGLGRNAVHVAYVALTRRASRASAAEP